MTHNETAEKERHLNRDWFHKKKHLIEVEMSQTQFAEMITSLNVGDGVPCTIRYLPDKHRIEDPPDTSQRQIFENEFKQEIKKLSLNIEDGIKIMCFTIGVVLYISIVFLAMFLQL